MASVSRDLLLGFAIPIVATALVALTSSSEISQNYAWIDWITHTGTVLGTLDTARVDSVESLAALARVTHSEMRLLRVVLRICSATHGSSP